MIVQVILIKLSSLSSIWKRKLKRKNMHYNEFRDLSHMIVRGMKCRYIATCFGSYEKSLSLQQVKQYRYKIIARSVLVVNSDKSARRSGSSRQFASTLTRVFSVRQRRQSILALSQRYFGFCRTCPYLVRLSADINVIGRRGTMLFTSYDPQFIGFQLFVLHVGHRQSNYPRA